MLDDGRIAGTVAGKIRDNGGISAYRIFTSHDGIDFGEPIASGMFPDGRREQIMRLFDD